MPDESAADDEALYETWRDFAPDEVADYFERLAMLKRDYTRLRDADVPPAMVAEAIELRDHGLHLGYLPVIRAVLAEGVAP